MTTNQQVFYVVVYNHPYDSQYYDVWSQLYQTKQAAKQDIEKYNTEMCERLNLELELELDQKIDSKLDWEEDTAYSQLSDVNYTIKPVTQGDGVDHKTVQQLEEENANLRRELEAVRRPPSLADALDQLYPDREGQQ
jgi:hypothetical protein